MNANGLASLFIGAYLISVLYHGNGPSLFELAKKDGGIIPWLISIAVLWRLSRIKAMAPIGNSLIAVAMVAMAIKAGGNLSQLKVLVGGVIK